MNTGLPGIVLGAAVQLAVTAGLAWWSAGIGKKHGGMWRHLVWLPILGFVIVCIGLTITIFGLVKSFSAVAAVDPSQKAAILAAGISEAMHATAICLPLSSLFYLVCVIGCAIGSVREGPGTIQDSHDR